MQSRGTLTEFLIQTSPPVWSIQLHYCSTVLLFYCSCSVLEVRVPFLHKRSKLSQMTLSLSLRVGQRCWLHVAFSHGTVLSFFGAIFICNKQLE